MRRGRVTRAWTATVALAVIATAGCRDRTPDVPPAAAAPPATAGSPASATPRASAPIGSPTASPEQAVRAAYQRYWEVYSQAVLDLDDEAISSVASGEELRSIQEEIQSLRGRGLAARVRVTHNVLLVEVSEVTATLYDEMVNNSFFVNAETKERRVASGSGVVLRDAYSFEKSADGVWKVMRSGRQR